MTRLDSVCFFFFQAEDGIRDKLVTGVQTCALPIYPEASGINWHRGVQPELGAEVRDRLLDELGIRGGEPGAGGRRILRRRGDDGVVQLEERGFLCARGEPRRIDPSQELDGIVLRATPQRRIG